MHMDLSAMSSMTMLVINKDIIDGKMLGDVALHFMFHELTTCKCKRNGAVVAVAIEKEQSP